MQDAFAWRRKLLVFDFDHTTYFVSMTPDGVAYEVLGACGFHTWILLLLIAFERTR